MVHAQYIVTVFTLTIHDGSDTAKKVNVFSLEGIQLYGNSRYMLKIFIFLIIHEILHLENEIDGEYKYAIVQATSTNSLVVHVYMHLNLFCMPFIPLYFSFCSVYIFL